MDDSRIFITGSGGQLGLALKAKYPNAKSTGSNQLDITSKNSVDAHDWNNIEVIINAAAYTDVDGSETNEGRINAWRINAEGVGNLIEVCFKHDITLLHLSSDYVFDGRQGPHLETEPVSPLGVYGQSKAAGDLMLNLLPKHYLIRTSWVIGEGKNFVRTMLSLGEKGIEPTVVNDQIGRPTFTSELVRAIDHLLTARPEFGTYNLSNDGEPASWANITREIFKLADYDLNVTDATTSEYFAGKKNIAPRPPNSMLSLNKIHASGFISRNWQDDLTKYIEKEKLQ